MSFRLPEPYPHADGSAEGVVDHVICLAPAHLEEVLGCFGGDGAQATYENDILRFEFWEKDGKDVAHGVVKENVENETDNW